MFCSFTLATISVLVDNSQPFENVFIFSLHFQWNSFPLRKHLRQCHDPTVKQWNDWEEWALSSRQTDEHVQWPGKKIEVEQFKNHKVKVIQLDGHLLQLHTRKHKNKLIVRSIQSSVWQSLIHANEMRQAHTLPPIGLAFVSTFFYSLALFCSCK